MIFPFIPYYMLMKQVIYRKHSNELISFNLTKKEKIIILSIVGIWFISIFILLHKPFNHDYRNKQKYYQLSREAYINKDFIKQQQYNDSFYKYQEIVKKQ